MGSRFVRRLLATGHEVNVCSVDAVLEPIASAISQHHKLKLNGLKYPVDRARGTSKKYDEL